jgi:hypothetical protein
MTNLSRIYQITTNFNRNLLQERKKLIDNETMHFQEISNAKLFLIFKI